MTVRAGLWANTPTNIGVALEADLANFGTAIRSFPAGVPCYAEDTQAMYIWDPQDTTSPSVVGQTVAVFDGSVQVGTWHAVGGGTVITTSLDTVVGATDSLKSTIPTVNGVTSTVKGYSTVGDGGSAPVYYWSAFYAGAANDGTIVRPTAAILGAWFAIYSGPINVLWFGAVGNGVADDRAAIMAALAALPVTGGGLYFPGGPNPPFITVNRIYKTSDTIPVTGYSNLIIYSDSYPAIQQTKNKVGFTFLNCAKVQVYGLRLQGTIQTDGGDPGGGNAAQTGIIIETSTEVDIHDCVFQNLGGYGVFPHNGVDCNVHHNQFLDTMAGCQAGGGDFKKLWITDNYFKGFIPTGGAGTLGSDDLIAFFGSALVGTNGQVLIARNIVDKFGPTAFNQARCIDVTCETGAQGGLLDIQILDNILLNCITTNFPADRAAIVIAGGTANILKRLIVKGNEIDNCNQGIEIQEIAGVEEFILDDNIITHVVRAIGGATTCMGIRLLTGAGGAKRGSVSGNIVQDVGGANAGALAAIYLDALTHCDVNSNIVKTCGDMGIFVVNGTDVTVNDNIVANAANIGLLLVCTAFRCNGNEVISSGNHGLILQNCTHGTCVGNSSHGNTLAGMGSLSGNDLTVTGNNSYGNGLYGFADVTQNVRLNLIGNNFCDNTGAGISLQGVTSNGIIHSNRLDGNLVPVDDTSITSTWIDSPATWYNAQAVKGANLTDANAGIDVAGGNVRVLYLPLTGNRTVTLNTTGTPEVNETITIVRVGTPGAFTLAVVNGGPGAGTLYTFPASVKRIATFWWDGTNWNPGDVQRAASVN